MARPGVLKSRSINRSRLEITMVVLKDGEVVVTISSSSSWSSSSL